MTAEEKMKRALAVENMFRLYKKYYPIWFDQKKQEASTSVIHKEADENSVSFCFLGFHYFVPRVTMV